MPKHPRRRSARPAEKSARVRCRTGRPTPRPAGTHSALTNTALRQESHFIAAVCSTAAEDGYQGLVLHSDPVARWTAAVLSPDGEVIVPEREVKRGRAEQKVRKQELGHQYAEMQLIKWGARPMRAGEKPAAWLADALPAARARKIRDPGKLRYVIALGTTRTARAAARREIAYPALPYPKPYLGQLELFSPHGQEARR
jgi:hypothetical protein